MSWFGTDLVSLGCILGGAAVGGAATYAVMDGATHGDPACAFTTSAIAPSVAVSGDGLSRAIVIHRSDVRGRRGPDCSGSLGGLVEIRLDRHLKDLDLQLEQLDQALEIQMEGLESQIQADVQQRVESQLRRAEARMREAEARLQRAGSAVQGAEAQEQLQEAIRQMEEAKVRIQLEKVRGSGS
jgi:hypothetical protein